LGATGCHSLRIYAVGLLSLLSFSSKMTVSPSARLHQIVAWLGADFEGCVVFDEVHARAPTRTSYTSRLEFSGPRFGSLNGTEWHSGSLNSQKTPNASY
jgi:hypothetical protein